jgi:plastocyanin
MPIQIIVKRETAPAGFTPETVNAASGNAVFWFNEDHNTTHQMCPQDGVGGDWGDPVGPQSSSMQVNLSTAGTFPYRCAFHDDETGVLVVT